MNIDQRLENALTFLGETDEKAAALKEASSLAEHRYKKSVDARFLALEGPIEQRKAQARIDSEPFYLEFLKATRLHDELANKRRTESIVVDVLRSMMADRRRGNVV